MHVAGNRLVAVLAAAVLGACGGTGAEPTLPEEAVERATLEAADVGAAFRVVERGVQRAADAPPPPRADPARFGRTGGWKARFARGGDATTTGPLVVVALTDRFADAGGAREDFRALARQLRGRRLAAPDRLGAEAAMVVVTQRALAGSLRSFTVVWRFGNVTATVKADGFRARAEDAVALARRQQAKLAAATRD